MTLRNIPFIRNRKHKRFCGDTKKQSRNDRKSELDIPFHIKRPVYPDALTKTSLGDTVETTIGDSTARDHIEIRNLLKSSINIDNCLHSGAENRSELLGGLVLDDNDENDDTADVILTERRQQDDDRTELDSMQCVERKYRAFVSAADGQKKDMIDNGVDALLDDVFHDELLHMMDGVAMNKTFFKIIYACSLAKGLKRSVEKFRVLDDTHFETVTHTKSDSVDFFARARMTVKDGKIIRVEKFESDL